MTADDAVLSRLPPALLAEAQARPAACPRACLARAAPKHTTF